MDLWTAFLIFSGIVFVWACFDDPNTLLDRVCLRIYEIVHNFKEHRHPRRKRS